MSLTVTLYPNTMLWVDGTQMLVEKRTKLTFISPAVRWLGNDWVMDAEYATTPVKRLYLAIQRADVGPRGGRDAAQRESERIAQSIDSSDARNAAALARGGQHYEALKLLRAVIQVEDGAAEPVGSDADAG